MVILNFKLTQIFLRELTINQPKTSDGSKQEDNRTESLILKLPLGIETGRIYTDQNFSLPVRSYQARSVHGECSTSRENT